MEKMYTFFSLAIHIYFHLLISSHSFLQVEILAPLDVGDVIDLKYLPEEDVIAVVASSPGSVSIFDLNTSMVFYHITEKLIQCIIMHSYPLA